jgi:hypothetical protein
MVIILPSDGPKALHLVYYRAPGRAVSPAEKEYLSAVRQPKERAKIDAILASMPFYGLNTPGIRLESVKGIATRLYELKIKAFGSEHRFLAGYSGRRDEQGRPTLILLKYIKKKSWKLDRTDIETAAARLAAAEREGA